MKANRFFEIDLIRGIAIIKMVIFNYSFALFYLGIYTFKEGLMFNGWAAAVFIFLVGVSLTLSYSRVRENPRKEIFKKYLLRGLKIFSLGLVITLVTWIFLGEGFIIFGILHLIGISIILAYPFLKYRYLNLFLGLVLIVFGVYLGNFYFNFNWLLWLGFRPASFYTVDYFPILPWFGLVLIGLFLGNTLYPNGERRFKIKERNSAPIKFLCFLGRKSLLIYLAHQPIFVVALVILFLI